MFLDPLELGQAVVVSERIAVDAVETLILQDLTQAGQVFLPARVKVQERWTQDLAICGDRDHGLAQGGHG